MSNQLKFGDHTTFHYQVLRMTLAGAALGLVGFIGMELMPSGVQAIKPVFLALAAAALGLAATPPSRKSLVTSALLALGVGLLGALSYEALAEARPRYEWFGFFVYGLTVGAIAGRDLKGHRRFLLPMATGLTVMVAAFVVGTFAAQVDFTQFVPGFVAVPAYGALFGFLAGVAMLLRQLWIEQDPVGAAFSEIRLSLSGEMSDLCERAMKLYCRVQDVLKDRKERNGEASGDQNLARSVQTMVLRIFALARKWQDVEREAARISADDLAGRVEELEKKIANSKDPVAKKQYSMARDALGSQMGYLRDISRNRERVTAQVYNYLAAMERLHLAVLNHRGADAAKLTDEIQPILDEMDDMGTEMDFESDALREANEVAVEAADEAAAAARGPRPAAEQPAAGSAPAPAPAPEPAAADAGPAAVQEPAAPVEGPAPQAAEPLALEGAAEAEPRTDAESRLTNRMFD